MNESKPKNMCFMYYIKISGDGHPIGMIAGFLYDPQSGWQLCNGIRLSVSEWPELYAVIGDRFCPEEIMEYLPRPSWQRLLMRIGFSFKPRRLIEPNPDYRPGFFRIPNMPGPT